MLLLGVLQAQAAGGVVGAGSFDLIEQQVLLSTETSIVFDNLDTIAAGYQHLQIRVAARGTTAITARPVIINFNGDTTASYSSHDLFGTGSGSPLSSNDTSATRSFFGQITAGSNTANAFGAIVSDILDPFNTSKNTTFRSLSGHSASDGIILMNSGAFYKTEAITSITLTPFTDSFAIGSRFSLYGLKVSA